MLSNKYLLLVVRLFLGSMFIVASIDKIAAPDAFAANIVAYKLVPYALVNAMALFTAWLELLCGIFLVGGVYLRGSSALVSAMLVVFIIAIASALLRELKIDCGCFGKEHATPVSWMKVLEDVGLLVLALYSYRFSRPPEAAQTPGTHQPSAG